VRRNAVGKLQNPFNHEAHVVLEDVGEYEDPAVEWH